MSRFRAASAQVLAANQPNAGQATAYTADDDRPPRHAERRVEAKRIGLFGLLGSGNIGNDASMVSVLTYLRKAHPDAVIDAMCSGPQQLHDLHGVDSIPIFWYQYHDFRKLRVAAPILKVLGKGFDVVRTAAWVRRHDVVIVPGMGVLETDLPINPFGFPYAIFLLSACGRVLGTKVALVGVGANVIKQRATRWFFAKAAQLATYRSYRDDFSRQAMRTMGVASQSDDVSPDVAFGLPLTASRPGDAATVAVGVMDFHGSNDDRAQAAQIYSRYLDSMTRFTAWLVAQGWTVRLIVGDATWDTRVAHEIVARVADRLPSLDPDRITAQPISTVAQLVEALASARFVVAARYHNVILALRLNKPTIAVAYAHKHEVLMSDMHLSRFIQHATSIDVDQMIAQFNELEACSDSLIRTISERNAVNAIQVEEQFKKISDELLSDSE
jgi:polysaccharide pyruvyl transferase WcaK-like protein